MAKKKAKIKKLIIYCPVLDKNIKINPYGNENFWNAWSDPTGEFSGYARLFFRCKCGNEHQIIIDCG